MAEESVDTNDIIYTSAYDDDEPEEDFSTTFWQDFTIADGFGMSAILDTFKRAFNEWKDEYKYLTALVITLNHKIYQYYGKNGRYTNLYNALWQKADEYAVNNLHGKELEYFYEATD